VAAAVAVAENRSHGRVLASAPTDVATDNLAARIEKVDARVVARYNTGKPADESRCRRAFVIRVYKLDDEVKAFWNLLKDPNLGYDAAVAESIWRGSSRWRLHLSMAYWLPVALRSPGKGIEELHPDASVHLFSLQSWIDNTLDWAQARAVATRKMTFKEFRANPGINQGAIMGVFKEMIARVDILCYARGYGEYDPCQSFQNPVRSSDSHRRSR